MDPAYATAAKAAKRLFLTVKLLTAQDDLLQKKLLSAAASEESNHRLSVLMVADQHVDDHLEERYRKAQRHNHRRYTMTTLVTKGGELRIEGIAPRIAVLDTGASAVILGRNFAKQFRECRNQNLTHGDTFITANGTESAALGRSKMPLEFILADGTTERTVVHAKVLIADTNAYDVILGMDFLGPCFGYVDPLTEYFVWRVDCHETQRRPRICARLPAICRGGTSHVRTTLLYNLSRAHSTWRRQSLERSLSGKSLNMR